MKIKTKVHGGQLQYNEDHQLDHKSVSFWSLALVLATIQLLGHLL